VKQNDISYVLRRGGRDGRKQDPPRGQGHKGVPGLWQVVFAEGTRIADEDIIVYLQKRGSGTYSDGDCRGRDREFLDLHNARTAEQIAARPGKALCAIGFYGFAALIDTKPRPGARYTHSASEPYNGKQELSQGRPDAWIGNFGMHKFQSHRSGHAR